MNMRKLLGAAGVACFMTICSGGVFGMSGFGKEVKDAMIDSNAGVYSELASLMTSRPEAVNCYNAINSEPTRVEDPMKKALGGIVSVYKTTTPERKKILEQLVVLWFGGAKDYDEAKARLNMCDNILGVASELDEASAVARGFTSRFSGVYNKMKSAAKEATSVFYEVCDVKRFGLIELGLTRDKISTLYSVINSMYLLCERDRPVAKFLSKIKTAMGVAPSCSIGGITVNSATTQENFNTELKAKWGTEKSNIMDDLVQLWSGKEKAEITAAMSKTPGNDEDVARLLLMLQENCGEAGVKKDVYDDLILKLNGLYNAFEGIIDEEDAETRSGAFEDLFNAGLGATMYEAIEDLKK